MNSREHNIKTVVALLTAITSSQEEIAYEIIMENDRIELFSSLCGILIGMLKEITAAKNITIDEYLKTLALKASNIE